MKTKFNCKLLNIFKFPILFKEKVVMLTTVSVSPALALLRLSPSLGLNSVPRYRI